MTEKLRVDKYLWAIRMFKTRTQAAEAIDAGKVKLNGQNIKPARATAVGDNYEIRTPDGRKVICVTALLHTRVAYAEAVNHYADVTPTDDQAPTPKMGAVFNTGKRQSRTGRPTKKQRRDLDDFMD